MSDPVPGNDRRSLRARRLLDPHWHRLRAALDRLYGEIEMDAQPVALSTTVIDAGGVVSTYAVVLHEPATIQRSVVTDPSGLVAGVEAATVDATPGSPDDV